MSGDFGERRFAVRFLTASVLFLYRLLDLLLANRLQLLVLSRRKNFLQLRCSLFVNRVELFHLLHWWKRRVFLDRFDFWSLLFQDRQELGLLFGRKLQLLR